MQDETYAHEYPARGSPTVAQRVKDLLARAGLPCASEGKRGLDHGAFVPMMPAFPEASIPVLQLSLVKGLDPALHIKMGQALRPLREEGVLLLGSGMSFHNMQALMSSMRGQCDPDVASKSSTFDAHLTDVCTNPEHCVPLPGPEQGSDGLCARQQMLSDWARFPHARFCHPREEHLAPLFVCAGAAGADTGKKIFSSSGGIAVSSYKFG